MSNPLKKLVSQTAVYGLSQIVGRFINYLLVPLHTALFAAGDYGINTLMYSYVTFLNVLLTYGMETAFFRFSEKQDSPKAAYSTALSSLLVSSISFAILITLISGPVAGWIRIPDHPEYVTVFAWIIALDAISAVPFAFLRHQNKALKFAIVKNINIFTNILLNLYFLLLCPWVQEKYGVLLPLFEGRVDIGQIFLANLIASIITIPMLWQEIRAIRDAAFNAQLWKEMLRYGLPLMVVGFAGMINETLDRIVLTYVYDDPAEGLRVTGIYGANYKLSILMSLFIQAFRYAAEPFFFSQAKTDQKRTMYAEVMNYFVLVCLVLFLMVTLFLDQFKYFINDSYWEGLTVVPILLIANLFLGIYFNLSIWYKLSDQTGKGAQISIIGAVITLVANFLLVPILGYLGSAWATLICYASMAVICYAMGAKYYPIPYTLLRIVAYLSIAMVLYGAGLFTAQFDSPLHYTLNALMIVGFAAFGYLFERKNKVVNSLS